MITSACVLYFFIDPEDLEEITDHSCIVITDLEKINEVKAWYTKQAKLDLENRVTPTDIPVLNAWQKWKRDMTCSEYFGPTPKRTVLVMVLS